MLEKGKINSDEFLILIIEFIIGASILTLPAPLTALVKQDAWIASALSTLISLFFILIFNKLSDLYPSMTYVEVNEKIFGKWMGKIIALLFLFYLYYLTSGVLREIGNFFTTQILVETPIEIIMIMFLLTCLIGVRLGLEVICRTAIIFFPWIILLLFIFFLFLIPEIKLENLQPVFEGGVKPIIKGSYSAIALPYLQLVIFLMITPFVTEKVEMKKAYYKGTFIGGIILTAVIMLSILVLGEDISARQSHPAYVLGKKISIGDFLERIEVIIAIIWIFTVYFKVTICYYALSLGLAQVLGLKDYQILLFPLALLIITFSIFSHPNIIHFYNFIAKAWTPYTLFICLFFPLLCLFIGKINKHTATKGT